MHGFVASLGAVPVAIDPAAHDRLVALTSHLPHALANLLVNQAGAAGSTATIRSPQRGGSLRDMTRVAGANPRIWVDIFLDNARRRPRGALASTGGASSSSRRARAGRRRLPRALDRRGRRRTGAGCSRRAYPDPGDLQRLRVHVPDRPGVIAGDHAGARRRADQHRGLRAQPRLARARRHAARAGRRRREAERAAAMLEEQGYGVVRLAGARERREDVEPAAARRRRASASAGATSRSRTARCCSARSPTGETRSRGFGRAADTDRRSPRFAQLGAAVDGATATDGCACRASGCAGCARPASRSTAATRHAAATAGGLLAGQEGRVRARRRRVAPLRGRIERIAEPLRADGRDDRDDRRPRAARDRGRAPEGRSATSCRSRARR